MMKILSPPDVVGLVVFAACWWGVGRLGWRSEFPWARFARWAERTRGVQLIERSPMPPLGHFALIRFGKIRAAADA